MPIIYLCRHCGCKVGEIFNHSLYSHQLGFQMLSAQERQKMINYKKNGDVVVKSICSDCHESLLKNPLFHECDYLIH